MQPKFSEFAVEEEFYFQWHITERCNLRCKHCYHESFESFNELGLEALLKIVDHIDQVVKKWGKKATLSLTGGEPLLRVPELKEIVTCISNKKNIHYFDLLTNGILLNEEILKFLAESEKLRRIQLSLEGPTPNRNDLIRGDGNFEQVLNAIDRIQNFNIPISIMITLTRINIKHLMSFVELAKKLSIDYLAFERFIPEGSGTDLKDYVLNQSEIKGAFETISNLSINSTKPRLLTFRPLFSLCGQGEIGAMCSAGINALTIMHDGTIYPCRRLPISCGNILKDGLYKIWYDSDILWKLRDNRNLKGKCNTCSLITTCRGCRAMAYSITGDYLAEDPLCWK